MNLLRQRAVGVWAVLVVATLLSWWLGADLGTGDDRRWSAVVIFAIACVKVRLIGLHFMELLEAPGGLRRAFEAYVVALFGLLVGMYLAA